MFSLLILFALFILEGSPTFGTTLDSVFIGYHARVNSRVMDIQITDVGDFKDVGGQEFNAVAFCPEANKDPIKLVKILFFTKMFSIH
jgi:hypothetical protein